MNDGISFWEGFLLMLIFIPLAMVWVYALMDLFRRNDLKGWTIALWIAALILLPFLGAIIYFLFRPVTKEDVEMQKKYLEQVETEEAAKITDKLHKLSELKDKGDITQAEFEKQKAKLLKD